MKKFISILTVAGILLSALSCEQKETTVPVSIGIQLQPAGAYSATSVYKITEDGERIAFNGTNANIAVSDKAEAPFIINLLKVVSQQVIIKELYVSGCLSKDGLGAYQSDQYFIIYNNSSEPADISNLVFGIGAPYESYTNNLYYSEGGELLYLRRAPDARSV